MRVFLDANILFSAAKSNGAIRDLLGRLLAGGHVLVADEYVVAEARRNLSARGFDALADLDELTRHVAVAPYRATRLPEELASVLAPKDHPVLAAAIRLNCGILVTGDRRHFGPLYGSVQSGVSIHSARSLAESLSL